MTSILSNVLFWSGLSGLVGTVLIFFFGVPNDVRPKGESFLILSEGDESDIAKAKKYTIVSHIGLALIAVSFLLQIINLL